MYSSIAANRLRSLLLLAVFFAIVLAIGWYFDVYMGYGPGALIGATVFAALSGFVGYWTSDKVALSTSRAVAVTPQQEPELHRLVENLAMTVGIPKPRVHIIEDASENAFATGRNPKHAAIAVTRGLMHKLSRTELEGVLAHELSHIKNHDILVMTLAVVFGGIIGLMAQMFLRFGGLGNRRSDREGGGNLIAIVGFILLLLAPLAAALIRLAVSRQREYLADASGALITRYPQGLADALKKISQDPYVETASTATSHLYIANPLSSGGLAHLFATHPPMAERIRRLERMTDQA